MRAIPDDIAAALNKTIQTKAENADPEVSLWISRKVTPLTENAFLETNTVNELTTVTDVSIAISHRKFGRGSDSIFIGFVSNGVGYVKSSPCYENMKRHTWVDTGFTATASDIAVAFDGTMPKDTRSKYEFITASDPWVFWVDSGAVYGKKLSDPTIVTLAESNATKVAAARAMWSDVPGFDFGLVLFMILNGAIYYRQLIDGVWTDAAPINFGPASTWVDIAAQRTWDYRVALQAMDNTGMMYEMFTQFEGMGSKNAEHLRLKDITSTGVMTEITYLEAQNGGEHLEVSDIQSGALYGGLYSSNAPTIINAYNLADIENNWGKIAVFVFDVHLNSAEIADNSSQFSIVDMYNRIYYASTAVLGEDGKTVTLTFTDFNNARGSCTAKVTAGIATSMAGVTIATTKSFVPTGLVPSEEPVPEIASAWNE